MIDYQQKDIEHRSQSETDASRQSKEKGAMEEIKQQKENVAAMLDMNARGYRGPW